MRLSTIEQLKKELLSSNVCRQQIVEMLTETMLDTLKVFDFGARKHPDSGETPNFLTANGNKCELKVRGKSILGHAASSYCNIEALDEESHLPHMLHLMASAAILYIRNKRKIVHPEDEG
jgi:hypothetical protein